MVDLNSSTTKPKRKRKKHFAQLTFEYKIDDTRFSHLYFEAVFSQLEKLLFGTKSFRPILSRDIRRQAQQWNAKQKQSWKLQFNLFSISLALRSTLLKLKPSHRNIRIGIWLLLLLKRLAVTRHFRNFRCWSTQQTNKQSNDFHPFDFIAGYTCERVGCLCAGMCATYLNSMHWNNNIYPIKWKF